MSRTVPVYRQAEATECGLACVGMVAAFYGRELDLPSLRRRFPVSMQGATLDDLIRVASGLGLSSRAIRTELGGLKKIRLPAILHWDFNHFVVLAKIGRDHVIIHDPAAGKRRVSIEELSRSFTGVALELGPGPSFEQKSESQRIGLMQLFRQTTGLGAPVAQILVFSLLIQLAAILMPFFSQLAIDNVVPASDLYLLKVLALGFTAIYALQPLIEWLRRRLSIYVATQFSAQLTANILRFLLSLPLPYFEKRSIGDLLTRFEASDRLRDLLTQGFVAVFVDGLLSIVTLAMMFYYDRMLGIVVLLTGVLVVGLRAAFVPQLGMLVNETLQKKGREQSEVIETLRGISSVKFARKEVERESLWNSAFSSYVTSAARLESTQANYVFIRDIVQNLSMVLLIYLGIRFVINPENSFTVGAFFAFAAYRNLFFERLTTLMDMLVEFSLTRVHLDRLSEILSERPETEPSEYFAMDDAGATVELRNVGFSFAPGLRPVLDDVSLTVRPGDRIALFGPSGTGKTTLLKILGGVYEPTAGEVRLNGVDAKAAGIRYLRSSVAAVLQGDYLFRGSLIDNITFFDRFPDFDRAVECAKTASIHDDIMAMPMSYETLIGEMGTALSQGQQQRVLIARALYQDKPILILDEGTAHLDDERETAIMDALAERGLTLILAAHKPSLASYATSVWRMQPDGSVQVTPAP